MTKRQFELIALALAIAYAILFFTARDPVCRIGSVGRASINCRPPPAPDYQKRAPNGVLVLRDGNKRTIPDLRPG